jgi:hypothetical protein
MLKGDESPWDEDQDDEMVREEAPLDSGAWNRTTASNT